MRISHVLAGTAMGAALLLGGVVAAPAQAATAPADSPSTSAAVAATWQQTGEYFSTESACKARKSYCMAASNVYDYRCKPSGSLWAGWVLAD
ncbi:hypothetical protein GCM10009647_011160 [Streptomyces sanglieri]|uniref:Uncharacterized protein n=1 Tax=Streptomyces sanglieri TaxID=193460 RepID=A0ABW2WSF4_9ACTN|nr:hypothetical protein [Streptomyces sp. Wh19]MDV9199661.1 hypothetical protein [Streptomyces sp. Wh19]